MSVVTVHFEEESEDDSIGPLRMEHFRLPIGLWLVGLVISVLCLLAEIIYHRMTDVPIAMQPRVTQSTPELEVEHNSHVEDIEDPKV